jgi:hypothetical protein
MITENGTPSSHSKIPRIVFTPSDVYAWKENAALAEAFPHRNAIHHVASRKT